MSIKHSGLLSWVHERSAPSKHKDHAQDCGTLIEISVRRSCHGLCISDGVHPLGSHGHLAPSSGRIAAERYCAWSSPGNLESGFPEKPCENARKPCSRELINDECCAFRAAPCTALRPSS